MERLFLVLGALFAVAQAGPIEIKAYNPNALPCAATCTESTKFGYTPGSTYTYQYESDIKSEIQGTSQDYASLHVSATVQLDVISKCDISMKLSGVSIKEYDPEDTIMKDVIGEFSEGLEKHSLRFSFQDGKVEQLCLTGEEPTWVLNAKRGIISLIQNNMEDFKTNHTVTETDVTGTCKTEYHARESGWFSTTTVEKKKNLLGCTDRHGYKTAIQAVPYTAESNIQSLPLLKSDHNCVHEITKDGYLKSVTCEEAHVFRPFSKSNSGAATINKQTLTFIRQSSGVKQPDAVKSTASLKFDHGENVNNADNNRKDITRKLQEICDKTANGVRPETPQLFTDLVYLMKSADEETISGIYSMLKKGIFCPENLYRTKKYFLDALPIAGTAATLGQMTELITTNAISGTEADMWMTSLSFIKNPTLEMIKAVKPLINMPSNPEKAMLSVGTMVHSFCVKDGDCDNDKLIQGIISTFAYKMGAGCKIKENNFKTTLMALRAIGNAGYAKIIIPKLEACMKIKQNPMEIRLSAIEAFRRIPCGSSRAELMKTLQDTDEDSEIRIAAYKMLMECPDKEVLKIVRSTLAKEEVNQVGSYIWTHLTNLMETSDRNKQEVKSLLEDETFKKEFDLDKRKFSRNYESSFFIDHINTGAMFEGDLIWSTKSFLPRSAMVNLTCDLFGHSVNMFELGGRAEGLEYFFEAFFGPNGYFNPSAAASSEKDLIPDYIDGRTLKKIDKRFSAQAADLRASMYMRVFGNELRYMTIQGMDDLLSQPDFNILEMLIKLAENNDYTYSHSTMFLDSSIVVPTGSGFPLNLTVNGTATIDLRMKGKMDLRRPPAIDINGRIQPSAAVDISSMMSVDAFVTKTGVKMVSTLHTSTAVQGVLKIDEKGTIASEFEMPEQKMEIIDVKSSFFTVHRHLEREQKIAPKNRKFVDYCSPSRLVTITGLELCAAVEYPSPVSDNAPYFPLSGPVSAGLYLYKRDTHTKYTMSAKSIHDKDNNIMKITVDTPGSRTNRLIDVDFNLNKKDLTLGMSLKSPWKMADVSGEIKTDRKESGVKGQMKIDNQYPYKFNAMLSKQKKGNKYEWIPDLIIDVGQEVPISLTGLLSSDNGKKVDISYELKGLSMIPPKATITILNKLTVMGVRCSVDVEKDKQYSADLTLGLAKYPKKVIFKPLVSVRTPEKQIFGFGGTFGQYNGKGVDANLVMDIDGMKTTSLKGKFMIKKRPRRTIYNTKVEFRSQPADFVASGKVDNRNSRTVATDFDITYNIRKISRDRLKIASKITNLSASSLAKGKTTLIVQSNRRPEYNVKVMSGIEHNQKHTELDSDLWFGADFKDESKHLEFRFESNRNMSGNSGDFMTRFKFPHMDMSMMAKGSHSHDSKNVNSNLYVKFGRNQPIETALQFHDNTGKLVSVTSDVKLTSAWYNFGIGLDVDQPTQDAYDSKIRLMYNNKRNTISTLIKSDEQGSTIIDSDFKLFNQSSFRLRGEFRLNPTDFKTDVSYEKGDSIYAATITSATLKQNSSWINVALEHPNRHVSMLVEGKIINNVYYGTTDINLNVDKKDDERFVLSGWIEPPTMYKVNGSISLKYPSNKMMLNVHHLKTIKYATHVDFEWAPERKVTADTTFKVKGGSLIGSAMFTSPYQQLQDLGMDITYSDSDEEYNIQSTTTWNKKNTVTMESYIKKPMSIKTFVSQVKIKSSFKELKNVRLLVDHKLSASLASSVEFKWNKQLIKADITAQNTTKGKTLGYEGAINVETTYRMLKRGSVDVKFDTTGKTFNAVVNLRKNKKIYSLISAMSHEQDPTTMLNDGSVTIKSPSDTYKVNWDHRYTPDSIDTSLKTLRGKQSLVVATLKSSFDSFDTSLEIQNPFDAAKSALKSALIQTSYHRIEGGLEGKLSVKRNDEILGETNSNYKIGDDKCSAAFEVSIPELAVNSKINGEISVEKQHEAVANLNVVITPELYLRIDGKSNSDGTGASTSEMVWTSSIPGYEKVKCTYELNSGEYLTSKTSLEYDSDKTLTLETKFCYETLNKHASIALRTPFGNMSFSQIGVDMKGDLDALDSEAFVEVQPLFKRKSVGVSLNTKTGFDGTVFFDASSGEKYLLATSFNHDKNLNAQATLSIPGRRDIKAIFVNENTESDRKYSIEVQHNRKNSLNADLTLSRPDESKFKISAQGNMRLQLLSDNDEYGLGYDLEGVPLAFTTTAKASKTSWGTALIKITTDFGNGLEGSLLVSSPNLEPIKASFSHENMFGKINSNANLIRGKETVIDLKTSLNTNDPYIGSLSLVTPVLKDIDMNARLDGHYDNFALRADGSYGQKTASVDASSVFAKHFLQQTLTVRALEKEFALELNHNGPVNSFKSFGELNIDNDRHRADLSFNAVDDVEGTIKLESPMIDPVSASVVFIGSPTNFNSRVEGSIAANRSSVDLAFSMTPTLTAEIAVKSPYTKDVSLKIDHSMNGYNLKSSGHLEIEDMDDFDANLKTTEKSMNARYSYGKLKSELDVSFDVSNPYSGRLSLDSHLVPERISTSFEHKGTLDKFDCHADLTLGLEKSAVDISYANEDDISCVVSLKTPKPENDMSMNVKFSGEPRNLIIRTDLMIGLDQIGSGLTFQYTESMLNSTITFTSTYTDDFSAEFEVEAKPASISSSFHASRGNSEIIISAQHQGELTKFDTHLSAAIGDQNFNGHVRLNLKDKREISLRLNQPHVEFDASVTDDEISIQASKDEESYTLSLRYPVVTPELTKLEGKFTSPLDGYRYIKATYEHRGGLRNIQCNGMLSVEGIDSTLELKLDTTDLKNVDGSLKVYIPRQPSIDATLSHSIGLDNFIFNAMLTADSQEIYGHKINYNNNSNEVQGNIKITLNDIVYSVIDLRVGKSQFDISSGMSRIRGDLLLDSQKRGSLSIDSPYVPLVSSNFDFTGDLSNFDGYAQLLLNGAKSVRFDATLKTADETTGSFSLEIPDEKYTGKLTVIPGDKAIMVTAKISDNYSDLIDAKVGLSSKDKLLFDVGLKSSVPHDLSLIMYILRQESTFSSKLDFDHDGRKIANGKLDYELKPFNLQGNWNSEMAGIKTSIVMNANAEDKVFLLDSGIEADGENWLLNAKYNGKADIDASVSIKIPHQDEFRGSVIHNLRKFKSDTTVLMRMNSTHYIETEVNRRWKDENTGIVTVKTPFEGFELSRLELSHSGMMKYSGKAQIKGDEYSASADASRYPEEANIAIKTPFEYLEDISLMTHLRGDKSDFNTGIELQYATGKAITLEINHKLTGLELDSGLKLMSPFTGTIVLDAKHSGTPTSFTTIYTFENGKDNTLLFTTSVNRGNAFLSIFSEVNAVVSGTKYDQKLDLKHDGPFENFKNEISLDLLGLKHSLDTTFKTEPVLEGSMVLVTPYNNLEDVTVSFAHKPSASGIVTVGELQFAPEKTIRAKLDMQNFNWKQIKTTVELDTPFEDMKCNKIEYRHHSHDGGFECDLDSMVIGKAVKATLDASKNPLSIDLKVETPIEGFEELGLDGNLIASSSQISSRANLQWNPYNKIHLDVLLSTQDPVEARVSLTTPFSQAKEVSAIVTHKVLNTGKEQSVKLTHNNRVVLDGDLTSDISMKHPSALLDIRSPWPMKFKTEGEFSVDKSRIDIDADWNSKDTKSNLKFDGGYDFLSTKAFDAKISQSELPGGVIIVKGELGDEYSQGTFILGNEEYGYDIQLHDNDGSLEVTLPTRTIRLSGSQKGSTSEGSLMWDADGDATKKIAFTASKTRAGSDITLSFPSISKDMNLRSQYSLNQGAVLFDGKTELSFSGDSSKTVTLFSKLMDISSNGNKNYSFSFGVSHPYSTIDIKVDSHIGKSANKLSAGIGMEYLTGRSQIKKFQLAGSIDQLRKLIHFELLSPVKTVSIMGRAETGDQFRLTLINAYDQKQPLYTYVLLDQSTRKVAFAMNYDLDNPSDELSISARYVNSSAVSAEISHTVRGAKITDVLTTARLNNSHLLHSRIHWRPEMLEELKHYLVNKKARYDIELYHLEREVKQSLYEELDMKLKKVQYAIYGDMLNEFYALDANGRYEQRQRPIVKSRPPRSVAQLETTQGDEKYIDIPSLRLTVERTFERLHDEVGTVKGQLSEFTGLVLTNTSALGYLKDYGIDIVLESWIKEYIDLIGDKLDAELDDVEAVVLSYLKSPFTVYDPQHGEIQIEIPIIVPIKSLDKLPYVHFIKDISEVVDDIKQYLPNEMPEVNIPDLSDEWLPPFKGVASVSKGHKITTFDGYVYDLDEDSTYILSRDYLNGNFTLILSNSGDTTLTVLSSGKPISINAQGQILLGGEDVATPFTSGSVSVRKLPGDIVNIKAGDHFSIDYDLSIDLVDISISGWYHGRTGGLLGIYDNEPSNDLMTSFGKVIDNSSRVSKTWDVSAI